MVGPSLPGAGGWLSAGMVERHLREHATISAVSGSDVQAGGRASPPFVLVPGRTGSGADRDGPACGIAAAWRSPGPGPADSWASQDAIPRAASTGSWYRQPPPAPASAIARSAS